MNQSIKVGDILIGKRNNGYVYTSYNVRVLVVGTHGENIDVRCLSGHDQSSVFTVDASRFEAPTKLRDLKKKEAPRFVKALVLAAGANAFIRDGEVVVLDLLNADIENSEYGDETLVPVIGNGKCIGQAYFHRFAVDPTLPVSLKERING